MTRNRELQSNLLKQGLGLFVVLGLVYSAACQPADPTAAPTPSPNPDETFLVPENIPTSNLEPTQQTIAKTPFHLQVDRDDLAGIVVRFIHPWTGDMAETIELLVSEYNFSNPYEIWVEVSAPGGDTAVLEALQADLADGDPPGLVAAHPQDLAVLAGEYYSVKLTDYFNNEEWGFTEEERKDLFPLFINQFTIDHELIALPVSPQATVIFQNQTWAAELGFEDSSMSSGDFRELSCEATYFNNEDRNPDNDGTGGWLVSFDPLVLTGWYSAFGGDLLSTRTPKFNTKAGEAAFGYLKEVSDQGCIWIGRQSEPYFYFANRYAVMVPGTLDQIPMHHNWFELAENDDTWRTIGFPGSEGETIMVNGPGLMLSADTPENQLAAWLFARHLLEPEIQVKLVQSGFTLPVRESALELLADFGVEYPQWLQGMALIDQAVTAPASEGWGAARWVLQDAIWRLFQVEANQLPEILEELDATIEELEGLDP